MVSVDEEPIRGNGTAKPIIIIIIMAVVHIWMPDLKKKTTARRITVASSVYKFTKDMLFKILYMNLLKIL